MHAVIQDFDTQRGSHDAAKARGDPETLVVTGGTVQYCHESHLTAAGSDGGKPVGEVFGARFFAGFNEAAAAGMR